MKVNALQKLLTSTLALSDNGRAAFRVTLAGVLKTAMNGTSISIEVDDDDNECEYEIGKGGLAMHEMKGFISEKGYYGWMAGMCDFREQLIAADNDPMVSGHVICVDSCGGEALACKPTYDVVASLNKPCVALVEDACCSAAYYNVCAADAIFAVQSLCKVGSIGTMTTVCDDSAYLESLGIKIVDFYSSLSPNKISPWQKAIEGDPSDLITNFLDPAAKEFTKAVKDARMSVSEDALTGTLYNANDAIKNGLIDGIKSYDQAINYAIFLTRKKQ